MAERPTDHMIAFVVEGYDPAPNRRGAVVVELARAFPKVRGLHLTLALSAAAEGMDAMWSGGWIEAPHLYRLASLVAVDVLKLEALGVKDVRAADLVSAWGRDDPVFPDGRRLPRRARADDLTV